MGASCVLVYRECGNNTIVVKEYPQNTVFPYTVAVDGDLENYTFAVFGRNNSYFDERPILTTRFEVTGATTPSLLPSVTIAGTVLNVARIVCMQYCTAFPEQIFLLRKGCSTVFGLCVGLSIGLLSTLQSSSLVVH